MAIVGETIVTSEGRIPIPERVRDALDLEPGTEVEFVLLDDGSARIRPKRPPTERLRKVGETLEEHDVDVSELRRKSKDTWGSQFDEEDP
ncbi:AbrB/MazE/SpoVT family DNA-binding domain-containing protein [Halolamina sp. CBA1230]|uniref:AbrB/MazE/SpoVT family DNA-binding domain-containing protein n=1 Tax=Halolamina sp. CBA1230 TaxID=1853690 RepID=UPI0009A21EFD|nr:AbrB/MazE/SpoVT family DNA-binding domain-containing protein [Halolamina sp. CBA1230]QKY20686.1 AbrB/MazE/SpoVT family DNA-binding domain-containing protein [Halolamina sp. CBA1230]